MSDPAPLLSGPPAADLFDDPDLMRAVLDRLPEVTLITDAAGRLLYVHPRMQSFRSLRPEDLTPEEWRRTFQCFDAETHEPLPPERLPLGLVLRGLDAAPVDLFVRADAFPEGVYVGARARPVQDRQGRMLGAMLLLHDIREERHARAERRRAEQRFRLIVEAAQEGIWMLDRDGHTTYANDYLARMLGYKVEQMLGAHVSLFTADPDRAQVAFNLEPRAPGRPSMHDLELRHREGRPVWTQLSSTSLTDENGQCTGTLATVTDITQRREAEQQVRRLNEELERRIAERTAQLELTNRELETFAYSVAHDLRAPLRAIDAFSLALSEDCPGQLDTTGEDYLQRIRAAAQRMSELIDGLLTLSHMTRVGLQERDVSLSALARAVLDQLQAGQPGRVVNVRLHEGLTARGDPRMLRSVLENLLGNAWKFTRGRAVAEIEFGQGPGPVYFVRDNGAGFDMEYESRLFGVFQRLHGAQEFEGHGVGLATVRRIIQRHGGRVWGEGRVDAGATFFFTLHEATPGGAPPPSEERGNSGWPPP